MSSTKRLRNAVYSFLEKNENANTTQIFDHINSRFRWGTSMNQLGNILAKDRRFQKVGFLSNSSGNGYRCRICVWALKNNSEMLKIN
tara:strand:+ start:471 stop:731 length:261 start_codon:yes stop_codon:yes gene_type:complete